MKKIQTDGFFYSDWANLIDECIIGKNAYRDREILKDSLLHGIPYEKIAENYKMSSVQIGRIVRRTEKILFKFTK